MKIEIDKKNISGFLMPSLIALLLIETVRSGNWFFFALWLILGLATSFELKTNVKQKGEEK